MSVSTGNTKSILIDGVLYAPMGAGESQSPSDVSVSTEAQPLLLTIARAAKALGVSVSTLQALYLSGEIESVTFGRARRIVYASLARWVDEHKRGAA